MLNYYRGLLLGCRRNLERACASEMKYTLINHLGYSKDQIKIGRTGISGLVSIKVPEDVNPVDTLRKLSELETETPFFVHTLKIRPIQMVLQTNLEEMKSMVKQLSEGFEGNYKVVVEKRHTSLDKAIIIDAAASVIEQNVDLSNPDWVVLIEVVGSKMGLSVGASPLIYSTDVAKVPNDTDTGWFL